MNLLFQSLSLVIFHLFIKIFVTIIYFSFILGRKIVFLFQFTFILPLEMTLLKIELRSWLTSKLQLQRLAAFLYTYSIQNERMVCDENFQFSFIEIYILGSYVRIEVMCRFIVLAQIKNQIFDQLKLVSECILL
jgi:hypothetical protein